MIGLDLIFLALVAGILVFRLYSTLGKEDGETQARVKRIKENLAQELGEIAERGATPSHDQESFDEVLRLFPEAERPIIANLKKEWAAFSPLEFLAGAKKAYIFVIESFAAGRKKELKPLVSQILYDEFAKIIDTRQEKGEVHEHSVDNVRSLRFVDTSFQGKTAKIIIDIHSFQTHVSKDKDESVLYETGEDLEEMWDRWTFTRDITKSQPSWVLVNIEATPRESRTE